MADSKEKKKCYLGSVRVKLLYTLMFAYMYILHTVLYTFPEVLTKRINNQELLQLVIISFTLIPFMNDLGVILRN